MKCAVHYIVHLQCTFCLVRMKVRDSDVLAWVRGQRKMSQVLGAFWAAGFHHVTARSRLVRVLKLMNGLFL
jgi:hypothetical protein